ncbi:MAG TPA: T9SS type B sorting domain-containing protein [Flavobacterium sp.]|nr:T9SS type B sorting domain-containing protein [Flavobacterium sp.]
MRKITGWGLLLLAYGFLQAQNVAPVLQATGNQEYCPGSALPIVTSMTITDPDDTVTDAIYIQISQGYVQGQDVLSLTGTHPGIVPSWDALEGKLTLKNPAGTPVAYTDFIAAIEDVVFTNSAANVSGTRVFSITVGQANYLPSTQHYYQYVPNLGITWSSALTAAGASTYYGLQGYLATILSADEAQLCGEQSAGAGWIGGSDSAQEGLWKWMTGPEAGTVFWDNGPATGFFFWNNGEPNNLGDEDYAHVTAPGVGVPGSWNDLSNTGDVSGNYQPKGYIVEYGGMPGDPILQISTTTSLYVPSISDTTGATVCGSGSAVLQAETDDGSIGWFASPTGGVRLGTGPQFTTPVVSATTQFYADPFNGTCPGATRTPVTLTVLQVPQVTVSDPGRSCGDPVQLEASSNVGFIRWYDAPTGGTLVGNGPFFTTPALTETTTYYLEADNDGCISPTRVSVTLPVYQKPVVADDTFTICPGDTLVLDAGVSNVSYQWSPTNETTRTINVTEGGVYSVTVTTPQPEGCSAVATFTVTEFVRPVISEIILDGLTATVVMAQPGDFEYSLDGTTYSDSPVLQLPESGLYTAYVREKNECGDDKKEFVVGMIPPYFTPNGDGRNDYWSIRGGLKYPGFQLSVFDRYGKLITTLSGANRNWDGTYNGRPAPAGDYWFVLKLDPTTADIRGHFSLLR